MKSTSITLRSREPILIPLSFDRTIEIWKVYGRAHLFRMVLPAGVRSSIRVGESFMLRPGRKIDIFIDGDQKVVLSRAPVKSQRLFLELPVGIRAWKRKEYAERRKPTVFSLAV